MTLPYPLLAATLSVASHEAALGKLVAEINKLSLATDCPERIGNLAYEADVIAFQMTTALSELINQCEAVRSARAEAAAEPRNIACRSTPTLRTFNGYDLAGEILSPMEKN